MADLKLSRRMRDLAQSDIRRMTLECERVGGINLGQGICDLPTIPELKEGLRNAVEANHSTYSRYDGIEELRRNVATRLGKDGAVYDPDGEIVVSVGSTGAFAMTMMALLDGGDEVLLPEPFYGYHWNTVVAAGGVPRPVPLTEPEFSLDVDALQGAVGPRTRAIVVCSPANPSGKVWTEAELDRVIALCHQHGLWAITDEIYEDILYDGRRHLRLAARPGGRDCAVTISGFSKTFSITGWRLGYAAAPREMAQAIGILNDLYYVCAPTPLQHAVAHALSSVDPSYYEGLRRDYEVKRDRLVETCRQLGWSPRVPAGAYYLMAEPRGLATATAREAGDRILAEAGVATVPGSAFYGDGGGEHLIRFCFAKTDDDLAEACRRLQSAFA